MKKHALVSVLLTLAVAGSLSCSKDWCVKKHSLASGKIVDPPTIHERYKIAPLAVSDPRDIMGKGLLPQTGGSFQIANAECTAWQNGDKWISIQSLTEDQYANITNETKAEFVMRDVERFGISTGLSAKVTKYAGIGLKAKYNEQLIYELKVEKQVRFKAPLGQHHAVSGDEDACADSTRVCGTSFVGSLYCGKLQFAKLNETAFDVNGSLKVKIVDISLEASTEYIDSVGRELKGCFLYEPYSYETLSERCSTEEYYGLTFGGPTCMEKKLNSQECIDKEFPQYKNSVKFLDGVKAYLEEDVE
jgi:hypothetical protein